MPGAGEQDKRPIQINGTPHQWNIYTSIRLGPATVPKLQNAIDALHAEMDEHNDGTERGKEVTAEIEGNIKTLQDKLEVIWAKYPETRGVETPAAEAASQALVPSQQNGNNGSSEDDEDDDDSSSNAGGGSAVLPPHQHAAPAPAAVQVAPPPAPAPALPGWALPSPTAPATQRIPEGG
jgi:hypothetical protein